MDNNDSKLAALKDEIVQTKSVMRQNIDKTVDRGERLALLEDKATNLNTRSQTFRTSARATKRHFLVQYWKSVALICLVITIFILIMYFIFRKK